MHETIRNLSSQAGLLLGLALLCRLAIGAEQVYKCVEGGKTRFSATPGAGGGNCQPMALDPPPPPDPVNEARKDKKSRAAEEKAQDARLRDLIQNDPDAQRRAQSAEMAKSLARQPVPVPSWGGGRGRRRGGGYSR